MRIAVSPQEFFLFSDFLEAECGITLNINKTYLLEERLSKLVVDNQCNTFGDLYNKLKTTGTGDLKMQIVDAMTVNETLWFRDESPYMAMRDAIFPEVSQKLTSGKKSEIRIWSAACSTGQEPYSIAMMAHETSRLRNYFNLTKGQVTITATDISPTVLNFAKQARYDNLAMSRGMKPEIQSRYFTDSQGAHVVKDEIRQMVKFQQFNLKLPFVTLGKFDIIFIRNVTIYFSMEFKQDLFKRIAQILNPGGILFIGATETLLGISNDFELAEHDKARYYKLKPPA
ncbi:MAG: protein-glutamate O-methyltransferase CheR [Cyanobacteria bacterium]|nr:protein-glutamate O-methyltransferase CheR [Cyanobacteriota bacterium]